MDNSRYSFSGLYKFAQGLGYTGEKKLNQIKLFLKNAQGLEVEQGTVTVNKLGRKNKRQYLVKTMEF